MLSEQCFIIVNANANGTHKRQSRYVRLTGHIIEADEKLQSAPEDESDEKVEILHFNE